MISDEVGEPVGGEFRKLYEEQKFGMPVRDALLNFADRIPLVDLKFFILAAGRANRLWGKFGIRHQVALGASRAGTAAHDFLVFFNIA